MLPVCTASARLTGHTQPLPLLLSLFAFLHSVLTFLAFTEECPGSSSTRIHSETASHFLLYRRSSVTAVLITSASPFRLFRDAVAPSLGLQAAVSHPLHHTPNTTAALMLYPATRCLFDVNSLYLQRVFIYLTFVPT